MQSAFFLLHKIFMHFDQFRHISWKKCGIYGRVEYEVFESFKKLLPYEPQTESNGEIWFGEKKTKKRIKCTLRLLQMCTALCSTIKLHLFESGLCMIRMCVVVWQIILSFVKKNHTISPIRTQAVRHEAICVIDRLCDLQKLSHHYLLDGLWKVLVYTLHTKRWFVSFSTIFYDWKKNSDSRCYRWFPKPSISLVQKFTRSISWIKPQLSICEKCGSFFEFCTQFSNTESKCALPGAAITAPNATTFVC